jgi:hypothetical protein
MNSAVQHSMPEAPIKNEMSTLRCIFRPSCDLLHALTLWLSHNSHTPTLTSFSSLALNYYNIRLYVSCSSITHHYDVVTHSLPACSKSSDETCRGWTRLPRSPDATIVQASWKWMRSEVQSDDWMSSQYCQLRPLTHSLTHSFIRSRTHNASSPSDKDE